MRTIAVLAAARVAGSPSRELETRTADSTAPDLSVMPTLPSVGPVETDSGPPRSDAQKPHPVDNRHHLLLSVCRNTMCL